MQDADLGQAFYYGQFKGGGRETVSGAGSTLAYTDTLRPRLAKLVRDLGAATFIDAPCGDFNWMQHVELASKDYIGLDLVPEIIEQNQQKFGSDHRKFLVCDVTADPLPAGDVLMCRDLLLHLPFRYIQSFFNNFLRSNIDYLLISNYTNAFNKDLSRPGLARFVNLNILPFRFPVVDDDRALPDWAPNFPKRYLVLYRKSEIEAAIRQSDELIGWFYKCARSIDEPA